MNASKLVVKHWVRHLHVI